MGWRKNSNGEATFTAWRDKKLITVTGNDAYKMAFAQNAVGGSKSGGAGKKKSRDGGEVEEQPRQASKKPKTCSESSEKFVAFFQKR